MKNLIKVSVVLLIGSIVLSGCSWRGGSPTEQLMETEKTGQRSEKEVSTLKEETIATKYFEANEADVEQKLLKKYKLAVFFYDEDCGSCRELDEALRESLDDLPTGAVVARLDYKIEKDFRSKYAVNYESSVLIFNEKGQLEELLVSPDLEQVMLSLEGF